MSVPTQFTTADGTLSGPVNGWNGQFTIVTPTVPVTVEVYRNGLMMTPPGDVSVTGDLVSLAATQTPEVGGLVTVRAWIPAVNQVPYNLPTLYNSGNGGITGTMNGVNNVFLVAVPLNDGTGLPVLITQVQLWWNGLAMTQGIDYALSGNTITMMAGQYPNPGDILTTEVFFS